MKAAQKYFYQFFSCLSRWCDNLHNDGTRKADANVPRLPVCEGENLSRQDHVGVQAKESFRVSSNFTKSQQKNKYLKKLPQTVFATPSSELFIPYLSLTALPFHRCKVRLTHDVKQNKFVTNCHNFKHDPPPISLRRRAGNLKAERQMYGLNPEYRKKKQKRSETK